MIMGRYSVKSFKSVYLFERHRKRGREIEKRRYRGRDTDGELEMIEKAVKRELELKTDRKSSQVLFYSPHARDSYGLVKLKPEFRT